MKLLIILLHLFLLLLLALQSFVNHSLFHNCPPPLSVLFLTSPVPHALLQIFPTWLNPSYFRFSYTSSAFFFKNSRLYARIQLLHSTEVTQPHQSSYFSCFVDRASLYNLVNKSNLVHNLFLVYLSIPTCFGQLCAHHQEKQLCLCDTWYLLFWVDDCLACRVEFHPKYQTVIHSTKCRINTVVSPDDWHIVPRNKQRLINILRINILRINCAPNWLYLQDSRFFYRCNYI